LYIGDLLGAFANLLLGIISFVMYDRPFVRPRGASRLPLDGFSWNFLLVVLRKSVENIQLSQNWTKIRGTLHEYVSTFMTPQLLALPWLPSVVIDNNQ